MLWVRLNWRNIAKDVGSALHSACLCCLSPIMPSVEIELPWGAAACIAPCNPWTGGTSWDKQKIHFFLENKCDEI